MTEFVSKRCPYCAEEIRVEAVKCRYCGTLLEGTALSRTWHRSRARRKIAGVCAGLAEEFGISVTVIRLAFVLFTLIGGGTGIIIYVVLWLVMPYRDTPNILSSPPPEMPERLPNPR